MSSEPRFRPEKVDSILQRLGDRDGARQLLAQAVRQNNNTNRAWIDAQCAEKRVQDPFTDLLMYGNTGLVYDTWSTMMTYLGGDVPPTMDELLDRVAEHREFYAMASPSKNVLLVYEERAEPRLRAIDPSLVGKPYGAGPEVADGLQLLYAHVALPRKGAQQDPTVLTKQKIRNTGIVVADVMYLDLEGRTFDHERVGAPRFVLHAEIRNHPHMKGLIYLNELDTGAVFMEGGQPPAMMQEGCRKIHVENITGNFIVDALRSYREDDRMQGKQPLLFRFHGYEPHNDRVPTHFQKIAGNQQH